MIEEELLSKTSLSFMLIVSSSKILDVDKIDLPEFVHF